MRQFHLKSLAGTGWRLVQAELAAVAALLTAGLGVLAFVEIADEVAEAEAGFDQAVLASLRIAGDPAVPVGPSWLLRVAQELTSFGDTYVLVAIALIAIGFLLMQKKLAAAALVVSALASGTLLSETLKQIFARDRPAALYRLAEVHSESFPSGHAMLSAVAYLTLGVLLARALKQRALQIYVLAVAFALTFVVGLTRIYLGVHWTTDVIAGWSLGAAWAMAWFLAAYAVERLWAYRAERGLEDGS